MSRRANLNETAYSNMGFGGKETPTIHCHLEWTCDSEKLYPRQLRRIGLPEYVDYNVTNMPMEEVERLISTKRMFVEQALADDFDEYFTPGIDAGGVFCGCDVIEMSLEPITSEVVETVDGELELDIPSEQYDNLYLTDISEDGEDIW